jgi:hypothetical protein
MIVLFNKKLGIFFGRREKSWECGGEHGIISQPGAMYVFLAPVFYGIAWSSSHCCASSGVQLSSLFIASSLPPVSSAPPGNRLLTWAVS